MRELNSRLSAIVIAIFLCYFGLYAQTGEADKQLASDLVEQAELVMEATSAMDIARDMYVQAANLDPENALANYKAGELYLMTVGKDKSVPFLKRVLKNNPKFKFDTKYKIGQGYQYGLEFDEAIDYYEQYKAQLEANPTYLGSDKIPLAEVERRIEECNNGIKSIANPKNFSITNLGPAINSEYDEYGPVISQEGDLMIFTSRRREGNTNQNVDQDNKPFEDVFYSKFEGDDWTKAKNIGQPINTEFHNSNLSLSADGNKLFVYVSDNNGDIMVCDKQDDGSWSEPYSIGENINSINYKESSVCLSPDGNVLYFSSNRPGGYGGTDIYYSEKDKKGRWKRAKNLGPKINTKYNDDGPFVHFSGQFLYFSSMGRNTMGGYDVYVSKFDDFEEMWLEAENMGYPICTPDDDLFLVMTKDGKKGYYASVRDEGYGFTDIYEIKRGEKYIPPVKEEEKDSTEQLASKDTSSTDSGAKVMAEMKKVILNLKVFDQSNNPLNAKVKLTNTDDQVIAAVQKVDNGFYRFELENANSTNFRLSVEKDGYAFENENMTISGSTEEEKTVFKEVFLSPLTVGTRKVLRNIYFDFNKSRIKQESYDELSKLENLLVRNPDMKIEIAGHTDAIGNPDFNKRLSQRRTDRVKEYLAGKGIDPRRIQAVGYGEEKPLATNDDEREGRELNRRVEFKVLEN